MVFPIALLTHPRLKDCDIRVLLALDHFRFRSGRSDGVIEVSTAEICQFIGKSVSTVRASLARIEAIHPPVLIRDMVSDTRRDSIQLCYDRYGDARFDTAECPLVTIAQTFDGAAEIPAGATPGGDDYSAPAEILAGDLDGTAEISASATGTTLKVHRADFEGSAEISAGLPIRKELVPVVDAREPAGASDIRAPATGRLTTAELMAWLPCVTDVEADLVRLRRLAPLWVTWISRNSPQHGLSAPEWIQDALLTACEKDDIVDYARKLLKIWVGSGGRPDFELAPKPRATPDETDTALPAAAGSARKARAKPERNASREATRAEAFIRHFGSKEANDGLH